MLSAAALAGLTGFLTPASASGQAPLSHPKPEATTARAARTVVTGHVSDESGSPVQGAMVTAIGATMALVTTDQRGRFAFPDLPRGEYIVRAQLSGFAASRREIVRVGDSVSNIPRLELRRLDTVTTSGPVDPALKGRTILAAGFDAPPAESADQGRLPGREEGRSSAQQTAWAAPLKRSILKDSAREVAVTAENDRPNGSLFGRAVGSAGNFATALFTDFSFSGEVNLLTTSAFAPDDLISGGALPRGVAYLSLGAPTPAGDWLVRAAMSEGDLASWIVAGSFVSKPQSSHAYTLGLSYSTQEYQGGNPAALAAVTSGSRNVGQIYAFDRWQIAPALALDFGGSYSRFDYLERRGLLSPRVGVAVGSRQGHAHHSTAAQRMVAGAEEFLPPRIGGPWLPPERTLRRSAAAICVGSVRATSTWASSRILRFDSAVRRFVQSVDDQLATLFGVAQQDGARAVGHTSSEMSAASTPTAGSPAQHARIGSRAGRDRLHAHARTLARSRRHVVIGQPGARADPRRARRHPRHHDDAANRDSRNGHARVRALQDQQCLHAAPHTCDARHRWPIRRADQSDAAVWSRGYRVGSAVRSEESVPRSLGSRIG
jgi:hypothetical protein